MWLFPLSQQSHTQKTNTGVFISFHYFIFDNADAAVMGPRWVVFVYYYTLMVMKSEELFITFAAVETDLKKIVAPRVRDLEKTTSTFTDFTHKKKRDCFKCLNRKAFIDCRQVNADKYESFSILATVLWTLWPFLRGFVSFCLPRVSVHIYWLCSEMFSSCTCIQSYLVSWWHCLYYCKPNRMPMLLLHCWHTVWHLNPPEQQDWGLWWRECLVTHSNHVNDWQLCGIMLQTYQQFSSCYY